MKKLIQLILLVLSAVYAHNKAEQECNHNEIDVSKIVPSDYLETFEENYAERNLQNSTPQPIRITLDYKEFDNPANGDGLTPAKRQYLKNIMEAAQIYLNKLIKVYPRTKPVRMTWGDTCYDTKVTREIQDVGIYNSDLHIFVTYMNKPDSSVLADAIWCQLDPNPIVGRVKFNIGTMYIDETSTQAFQDNFSTSLHEILHILGFSGSGINYWIDPDTGKPYGQDTQRKILTTEERWGEKDVLKVSSKNIVRVARNHYGCPSISGMYLENQGYGGSKGSHWERDLLGNEFMTGSIVKGVYTISEFTAALLLDTGYYAEINSNMLMPIYWGKNKGCSFYNQSCNTGQYLPEFPDKSVTETCDFFSLGIGDRGVQMFSQCESISPLPSSYCDDDLFIPDERLRQNTGAGSRCFRSNASRKGENDQEMKARCFKAKCAADNQSIEVKIWGNETVNCKYPEQLINLGNETQTTQGVMRCPGDFDLFCNFPRKCLNNCSNNGVCNNGYCVCLGGWAGEDCSKQCPPQFAWDGSRCVDRCPSGLFKNFDNVCKSTCPYKQYKDTNTGTCQLCHVNCSICQGSTSNQCTACNNGYTLSGNSCVEVKCHQSCLTCSGAGSNQCTSCSSGQFLDQNKTCQFCKSPCSSCINATQCTTCVDGYFMDNITGQCLSNSTCHNSCATCSAWRDESKCTSCREGYILSQVGKCVQCEKQCKKCSYMINQCTECKSGYTFDSQNRRCYMECDPSCQDCSQPKNSKACTACSQGKFLKDGQCLPCDSSCDLCIGSATFCIRCKNGDKLDPRKGTCSSSCRSGEFLRNDGNCQSCRSPCASCAWYEDYCTSCISGYTLNSQQYKCVQASQPQVCHQSCNTCNRYNDDRSCNSCREGMYLSNGSCLYCSRNCSTCSGNENYCTSCSNGYQLQNGQCVEKQNIQCHPSCKTCQNAANYCTSCPDGFDLNNGTCIRKPSPQPQPTNKCHPSCVTCFKDNDPLGCLTCTDNSWLQTNQDRSLARCLPCDSACKSCKSTYECTACVGETILDEQNYCRPCGSDEKFQNGKCVKPIRKLQSDINSTIFNEIQDSITQTTTFSVKLASSLILMSIICLF